MLLYIRWLSESLLCPSSKSRCTWNGRGAKRNCMWLKISLYYNVPNICEESWIQLSYPSPKSCFQRSFCRASADWTDSMLKVSSPLLRCRPMYVFGCFLNEWAYSTWSADWNGCNGFHWSECFCCMLYNPVALPYASPPTFATTTTGLWACVFIQSEVHVRSGLWGLWFPRQEYLEVVVHQEHCLCVDH